MPKLKHDILNDVVMDDEFKEIVESHKEKELTDVEKDLKIQADKVIHVINRTIARLGVVAFLPVFLEDDAEILKQNVKPVEVFFIRDLLSKYGGKSCEHSYNSLIDEYASILENINQKTAGIKSLKCGSSSSTGSEPSMFGADPYVSNLIDIIFYNNCLRSMTHTLKDAKVDRSIMKMIKAMQEFKEMAKIKLYITGEDEAELNKELREAFNTNALLISSIKELQQSLEKQRIEMGEQLDRKVGVFEKYNEKMEKIRHDFQHHIKKIVSESEEVMMETSTKSEAKQALLAEEAKRVTAQYHLLLEENLKSEKQSSMRRMKIETQLQNWLIKFDQEMTERLAEYEALEQEFNDEKAAMAELQVRFDEQSREYKRLMKEKAEEQQRIDNEMALQFWMNFAARKIQRTWRAYWQRKMARKKRKGRGRRRLAPVIEAPIQLTKTPTVDPNALLQMDKKFTAEVFDEIKDPNAFNEQIDVDL